MHGIIAIRGKIFAVVLESYIRGLSTCYHWSVLSCVTYVIDCLRVSTAVQVNHSVMAVHEEEFSTEGKIHGYHVY